MSGKTYLDQPINAHGTASERMKLEAVVGDTLFWSVLIPSRLVQTAGDQGRQSEPGQNGVGHLGELAPMYMMLATKVL